MLNTITYKINNCDYEIISCEAYKVVEVSKNPGYNVYFKCVIDGEEYDDHDKLPYIYWCGFKYIFLVEMCLC